MERNPKLKEACQKAKEAYLAKHATIKEEVEQEIPKVKDFTASAIINNLIQDEWQAIQGYNDAIATFVAQKIDEDTINIFRDILTEENVHIGQLQKALEMFSPSAEEIKSGEEEGAEQLNSQE